MPEPAAKPLVHSQRELLEWWRYKLLASLLAHFGLACSHLRSMPQASPLRDSLVKLTARDMRAVRLEGSSSTHLNQDGKKENGNGNMNVQTDINT